MSVTSAGDILRGPTSGTRRDYLKLAGAAALAVASAPAGAIAAAQPGIHRKIRQAARLERETFGLPALTVAYVDIDGSSAVIPTGYADLDQSVPARAEQLLQVGSITKSMTGLALFRLQEQGALHLDEPLAVHLPDLPLPPAPGLTLRTLLVHTSGLPNSAPFFPRGHERIWLGSDPASHFVYSNMGYALLGAVIERQTGANFATALEELIFRPLGMQAATAAIRSVDRSRYLPSYAPLLPDQPYLSGSALVGAPWVEFVGGAGSVAAPASDMVLYICYLLRAARGDPSPLLSPRSFEEMTKPVVDAPSFGPGAKYACGIAVSYPRGQRVLHHTGGMIGFSSAMLIDVAAGTAAFACSNASPNGYRPRAVAAYAAQAAAAVRSGKPAPEPTAPVPLQIIDNGSDYEGRYQAADGREIDVRSEGGRLIVEHNGATVLLERTAKPDLFAAPGPYAGFAFGFHREGGVVRYAYHRDSVYLRPGSPPMAPVPTEWQAYEGRYVNNDPWRGAVRVIARPDGLWLNGVVPLVHLGGTSFREGEEEWSPERANFDALFGGRFLRLNRSGVDYLRVPDELASRPLPASV